MRLCWRQLIRGKGLGSHYNLVLISRRLLVMSPVTSQELMCRKLKRIWSKSGELRTSKKLIWRHQKRFLQVCKYWEAQHSAHTHSASASYPTVIGYFIVKGLWWAGGQKEGPVDERRSVNVTLLLDGCRLTWRWSWNISCAPCWLDADMFTSNTFCSKLRLLKSGGASGWIRHAPDWTGT